MKNDSSQTFAIISSHIKTSDTENSVRSSLLASELDLANLNYKRIMGKWRGSDEESFVIYLPPSMSLEDFEATAIRIAKKFSQEAFVIKPKDLPAKILYIYR